MGILDGPGYYPTQCLFLCGECTQTPAPASTAIATLQPGQSLVLTSLHMHDELNGWGIDAGGHIIHMTDGGRTWEEIKPVVEP